MYIEPCPKCGRMPKIRDVPPNPRYKNGARKRYCGCPNLCSVVPIKNDIYCESSFLFVGEGDDNKIFSIWNHAVALYNENKDKPWYERNYETFEF